MVRGFENARGWIFQLRRSRRVVCFLYLLHLLVLGIFNFHFKYNHRVFSNETSGPKLLSPKINLYRTERMLYFTCK